MWVGINYPWIDYGWDFGPPPSAWIPGDREEAWRASKRRRIEEDFRLFAELGLFAVRWFLLGDGLNYGTGEWAPRKEQGRWVFDPLPEGHPYYAQLREDFEFVLQACRAQGLQLFPSLLDFHWCLPGAAAAGAPGVIKGGRADCVRDPGKRRLFLDRVLDPLLGLTLQYRDSVYAWELINEPEWVLQTCRRSPGKDGDRAVSKRAMRAFLKDGIHRIHASGGGEGARPLPSSVGFAHWRSLDLWDASDLGFTLPQFHYYAQRDRELPECGTLGSRPVIIGEFASAEGRIWPELKALNMSQSLTNRLRHIEGKGYSACFLWSVNATDRATRWDEDVRREIAAYGKMRGRDAAQL